MAPRVVSLVPSATETLLALGVRPVACTRFCLQPGIRAVGGTKDPDVDAIVDLAPDLVVVNDEENRREDADALVAAGLAILSVSPRAVDEVAPAVRRLAGAVGVGAPDAPLPGRDPERGRVVAFVWRRPWMTQTADTYGASVLDHLGWRDAVPAGPSRYPELTLDAVAAIAPDLVVLPDEPYPFGARHVPEVRDAIPRAHVALVDGRDLFWWGVRTPGALRRLAAVLTPPAGPPGADPG
jgi:ABC-type Fe3+-hydroxamate transport system substrate-binding protein